MRERHVGIWIDHKCAQIVESGDSPQPDVTTIISFAEPRHRTTGQHGVPLPGHIGCNMESRDRNRRHEELNRYYDRVIKELPGQAHLLIMGPGKAKEEFILRIGKSGTTRLSLQSETAPKLSERQIAERVRRFAADLQGAKLEKKDLIVMAASAGGIEALSQVLSAFPAGFPATVAIVLHRAPTEPNLLPEVLGRHCKLPVKLANAGELLQRGTVYLAPPDRHLSITPHRTFRLSDGHRIRHVRSSANPLFESAAGSLGKRVIGVVLTGGDSDATDGVQCISKGGGVVIAQAPSTCLLPYMPLSAMQSGAVRYVLPLSDVGPALVSLVESGTLPGPAQEPKEDQV